MEGPCTDARNCSSAHSTDRYEYAFVASQTIQGVCLTRVRLNVTVVVVVYRVR